jgi:hypothetical protein
MNDRDNVEKPAGRKPLNPDPEVAARYLEFLTGEKDPVVCLQWFNDAKHGAPPADWTFGKLKALTPRLTKMQRATAGGITATARRRWYPSIVRA